ncbi:uncharacterized protein LOC141886180 [Acropora palmata]|uniref:uncharacterized protein LOC141886180 n=1 Tax=Acropora palmata TaxID=6131 RepID=UPI003DA04C7D
MKKRGNKAREYCFQKQSSTELCRLKGTFSLNGIIMELVLKKRREKMDNTEGGLIKRNSWKQGQLLSYYEVVAQRTFAFVPRTLFLIDLKLVEAITEYLNLHLQANSR